MIGKKYSVQGTLNIIVSGLGGRGGGLSMIGTKYSLSQGVVNDGDSAQGSETLLFQGVVDEVYSVQGTLNGIVPGDSGCVQGS